MQELNDFLNMGGYAAYVWSAFGLSFVTLLVNAVLPLIRERKLLQVLRNKRQREGQSS